MNWKKTATQIVNDIDDRNHIGWDTDANICILTGFIESHCVEAEFEKYVNDIAKEDLANSENHNT